MFKYLKKYIVLPGDKLGDIFFQPLDPGELDNAELKLGFKFPVGLRDFYQEIGCGMIRCGEKLPAKSDSSSYVNRIIPPLSAAMAYHGDRSEFIGRPPGSDELPFFETSDSNYFILNLSDDPPSVYRRHKSIKVADTFEEFIHKLFYTDPRFYLL